MLFLFDTIMLHMIIPMVAFVNFLYERIKLKMQKIVDKNMFYYAFLLLVSPFIYLILNLTVYFSFGAKESDNVYPFMAAVQIG